MFKGALAAAFLALLASSAMAIDVEWMESLDSALKESARSRKPIFLHFYADWCVPCHRLERVVFGDDEWIRTIHRSFVPLKINLDMHPDLAKKFGVTSIPTDVYLTPSGEVIANERSPSSVEGYSHTMAQISKQGPAVEVPPEVPRLRRHQRDQIIVKSDPTVGDELGLPPVVSEDAFPVQTKEARNAGRSFFAEALGQSGSQVTASRDRSPVK